MIKKATLLTIFLIIQLITIAIFYINKQHEYVLETLLIVVGAVALFFYEKKKNPPISNYLRIIVYIAISGHTVGGEVLNIYAVSSVYDKFLHFFGIYAFAMLAYVLLGLYEVSLKQQVKAFLIVAVGLSLGASYEIFEFAMDQFGDPPIPAQSGLVDTNLDLLCDLCGAALAAVHISIKEKYYIISRV